VHCSEFKKGGRRATCPHVHYVIRMGFRRFRPREMSGATSTNVVQVQTQSEKGENDGRWSGGRMDRGERVRDTRKQFSLSNIRCKCYFIHIHSFFSLHGTSMYLQYALISIVFFSLHGTSMYLQYALIETLVLVIVAFFLANHVPWCHEFIFWFYLLLYNFYPQISWNSRAYGVFYLVPYLLLLTFLLVSYWVAHTL
jgi:hypothetical protein